MVLNLIGSRLFRIKRGFNLQVRKKNVLYIPVDLVAAINFLPSCSFVLLLKLFDFVLFLPRKF